jgi:hypothetical protein
VWAASATSGATARAIAAIAGESSPPLSWIVTVGRAEPVAHGRAEHLAESLEHLLVAQSDSRRRHGEAPVALDGVRAIRLPATLMRGRHARHAASRGAIRRDDRAGAQEVDEGPFVGGSVHARQREQRVDLVAHRHEGRRLGDEERLHAEGPARGDECAATEIERREGEVADESGRRIGAPRAQRRVEEPGVAPLRRRLHPRITQPRAEVRAIVESQVAGDEPLVGEDRQSVRGADRVGERRMHGDGARRLDGALPLGAACAEPRADTREHRGIERPAGTMPAEQEPAHAPPSTSRASSREAQASASASVGQREGKRRRNASAIPASERAPSTSDARAASSSTAASRAGT